MHKNFFCCLLLIGISVMSACDPSKKLVNEGDRFYQVGNYDDAANYYYNALLLNPNNIIARQALQKSGSNVLTAKFVVFGKYVTENNAEAAVRQYINTRKYYNRVKSVGVELNWPDMYNEVYEDIKNEYISKQYDQGLAYIQQNKYDKAELIFENIASIDSTYKDATVLRLKSIIEPLYQHGLKMMEAENYKEAYRDFTKVINQDASYKNAKYLHDEVLKKASMEVGILPVQNQTRTVGFDNSLYEQIMAELVRTKSPFLKIIDKSSLEKMLKEQQQGLGTMIDPESAASAGKTIGLHYVLMTALSDLQYETAGPQTDSVEAYLAFTESTNAPGALPQSVTRFKKVNYADTYQKRRVYYRVFYQLVSTQTAQVVASDVITEEHTDEHHVRQFKGDVRNLYPELPTGNDMPRVPRQWRDDFGAVKRNILSKEEITYEVCKTISQKMAEDIRLFIER